MDISADARKHAVGRKGQGEVVDRVAVHLQQRTQPEGGDIERVGQAQDLEAIWQVCWRRQTHHAPIQDVHPESVIALGAAT